MKPRAVQGSYYLECPVWKMMLLWDNARMELVMRAYPRAVHMLLFAGFKCDVPLSSTELGYTILDET